MKKQEKLKKETDVSKVIAEYTKDFGEGIFWDLTTIKSLKVPFVATSSISLNWLFGVGGVPSARLIEIFGKESSGKSSLCLKIAGEVQKTKGGLIGYIDTEHAIDLAYAAKCGINIKKVMFAQPDFGEQALSLVEHYLSDSRFSIVILDSIASLAPKAEEEGDMGDRFMGLSARMNSQSMRRMSPLLKRTKAVVIFVNQVRANLSGYGPMEESGGGMALRHAYAVRIHIKRREMIQSKGKDIGFMAELKTLKNKVATPFRSIKIPMLFGYGFDSQYGFITMGLQSKVISKTTVYKVKNVILGKSWKDAYDKLEKNKRLKSYVEQRIEEYLNSQVTMENIP